MAWLATRRRALLWTMALLLSACGGGVTKTTDPPPSSSAPTTRGPIDLGTLPTASAAATTLASSLPPGVTEADRAAVEQAAKEWWEEWYRTLDKLPAFEPNGLESRATSASEDAKAIVESIAELSRRGLRPLPRSISQITVSAPVFTSSTTSLIETCVADDGGFEDPQSGERIGDELSGGKDELTFERVGGKWLYSSRRTLSETKGQTCGG